MHGYSPNVYQGDKLQHRVLTIISSTAALVIDIFEMTAHELDELDKSGARFVRVGEEEPKFDDDYRSAKRVYGIRREALEKGNGRTRYLFRQNGQTPEQDVASILQGE